MILRNPFVYGEEVSGENFSGRKKEISEFFMDIRSGQNVILFSPGRYGKISLIKQVLRNAEKEGIISVLYRSLSFRNLIFKY